MSSLADSPCCSTARLILREEVGPRGLQDLISFYHIAHYSPQRVQSCTERWNWASPTLPPTGTINSKLLGY